MAYGEYWLVHAWLQVCLYLLQRSVRAAEEAAENYHWDSDIKVSILFPLLQDRVLPIQNTLKDLDPSYKMDLDF